MKKQTLPYILLIFAAALLYWIKTNQRKSNVKMQDRVTVQNSTEAYSSLRDANKKITYSRHAKCRMDCRKIDESEVKEILESGVINFDKDKVTEKGVTYPLEGKTHDGQNVRIVFAPKQNEVVVVTAIDLDTDWPCGDCN
jgi:hypothetical protein